jgi:hypothetical protein
VVAIARDVDVFGPSGGRPVAHVDEARVLERREAPVRFGTDHGVIDAYFVRLETPSGIVEGYASVEETRPRRGVGLFVAHATPIVAGDGRPVGTAHRGAFLPLVRFDRDVAQVALPPFGATGRVARASLTVDEPIPEAQTSTAGVRIVENRQMPLLTGAGPVVTTCAERIVIGVDDHGAPRASQTVAGIEITGRAEDPGVACPPRVVQAVQGQPPPTVPAGWVAFKAAAVTALTRSHDFFRIERDEDSGERVCKRWSFRRDGRGAHLTEKVTWSTGFLTEGQGAAPPFRRTTTYGVAGQPSLSVAPSVLTLPLESSTTLDRNGKIPAGFGEGIALCGDWTVTLVGETPDGLLLLDSARVGGIGGVTLVAYHPADVDVWYTRREACENAVADERNASASLSVVAARLIAPARHSGC